MYALTDILPQAGSTVVSEVRCWLCSSYITKQRPANTGIWSSFLHSSPDEVLRVLESGPREKQRDRPPAPHPTSWALGVCLKDFVTCNLHRSPLSGGRGFLLILERKKRRLRKAACPGSHGLGVAELALELSLSGQPKRHRCLDTGVNRLSAALFLTQCHGQSRDPMNQDSS